MQQVQDKSNKAESETQRQRVVIEEQARLIKELSQRLSEPTAPPAITAGSTASYRTADPAWSADRNAGGACRAASSEELLLESAGGPTDAHQSVFRHQRGWVNPQLGAGGPPGPGSYMPPDAGTRQRAQPDHPYRLENRGAAQGQAKAAHCFEPSDARESDPRSCSASAG